MRIQMCHEAASGKQISLHTCRVHDGAVILANSMSQIAQGCLVIVGWTELACFQSIRLCFQAFRFCNLFSLS